MFRGWTSSNIRGNWCYNIIKTISENACVAGETIHNLAGDVQPVELYDAILQADAMGKIALGK